MKQHPCACCELKHYEVDSVTHEVRFRCSRDNHILHDIWNMNCGHCVDHMAIPMDVRKILAAEHSNAQIKRRGAK